MGNVNGAGNKSISTFSDSYSSLSRQKSTHQEAASDYYQTAKGEIGLTGAMAYQTGKELLKGDTLGGTIAGGATAISGAFAIRDGMKGWSESQKADACAVAKFEHIKNDTYPNWNSSAFEKTDVNLHFESQSVSQSNHHSLHPCAIGVEEYSESSSWFS